MTEERKKKVKGKGARKVSFRRSHKTWSAVYSVFVEKRERDRDK
jgi:hypothetical protein